MVQKHFEFDRSVDVAIRTAAEYARYLGSESVTTEHLLLGFLRTGDNVFRQASNPTIRDAILERLQRSPPIDPSRELPFSSGAMRALRLPVAPHQEISPRLMRAEDILAAIIEDSHGVAAAVLSSFGITSRVDIIRDNER